MEDTVNSYKMSKVPTRGTTIEMLVRNYLWHAGFRYRVNVKQLPGCPDIVLPKYRSVIFVHGCFWHGHKGCKNYTVPKTNTEFWVSKVRRNKERDQEVWRKLEAKDWNVIVVWECELEKKRFEETLTNVISEIKSNGDLHCRHLEERRAERVRRMDERKKEKAAVEAHLLELSHFTDSSRK